MYSEQSSSTHNLVLYLKFALYLVFNCGIKHKYMLFIVFLKINSMFVYNKFTDVVYTFYNYLV